MAEQGGLPISFSAMNYLLLLLVTIAVTVGISVVSIQVITAMLPAKPDLSLHRLVEGHLIILPAEGHLKILLVEGRRPTPAMATAVSPSWAISMIGVIEGRVLCSST